jgi:nicotinamidase-related amidase
MNKTLYIVIDVQNDFISGALGSEKAQEVTPKIADFLSKV